MLKTAKAMGIAILIACVFYSCSNNANNKPKDSLALLEKQLENSNYIHKIMLEDPSFNSQQRWEEKTVNFSRKLVITEGLERIEQSGIGVLSFDKDFSKSGEGSIKIECPVATDKKNPSNRSYGSPGIFYALDNEDISQYNRLSMWVYADTPGFYNAFISFGIHNQGEHIMPVPGRFEGTHCPTIYPGQWYHILWEIPDIYRDNCSGISANISMLGQTQGSSDNMAFYIDDIRLENVDVDNSRGFDLRKGSIAYSHSGYRNVSRKQALVQNIDAKVYYIIDAKSNRVKFKGKCIKAEDGFSILDFSEFEKEGSFYIKVGDLLSDVFPIGKQAYLQTAWRGVNFFYNERCGFDLEGVHDACHRDVLVYHPDGRVINFSGGWHDAADLTQGPGNNDEAIIGLLEIAQNCSDPALRKRALEEARWGLNWILGTRFGDAYRAGSLIIGIWTDNTVGTKDDMSTVAVRDAESNFRCAEALAMAAESFADEDEVFARWCRNAAVEDFAFALSDMKESRTDVDYLSFAIASALRLFSLTSDKQYLDFAVEKMNVALGALEFKANEDWNIPLRGYLYEDNSRSRTLAYYHQSQEHRMAQNLSLLLKAAPSDENASLWKEACKAMGEYYLLTSEVMAPYGLLPAAIYEVDNTDYSNLYHEGDQVGLPTLEEYNAQVRNGIALTENIYLRRFPVAYQFRGFNAVTLSKAKAAFILSDVLEDKELGDIAARQVEWVIGFNPFACSTVFGDGYDYHPLYDACAGRIVGSVPVGIETFENEDEPYWPTQINCTYKEIWTHSSARLLSCVAELFK